MTTVSFFIPKVANIMNESRKKYVHSLSVYSVAIKTVTAGSSITLKSQYFRALSLSFNGKISIAMFYAFIFYCHNENNLK